MTSDDYDSIEPGGNIWGDCIYASAPSSLYGRISRNPNVLRLTMTQVDYAVCIFRVGQILSTPDGTPYANIHRHSLAVYLYLLATAVSVGTEGRLIKKLIEEVVNLERRDFFMTPEFAKILLEKYFSPSLDKPALSAV